MLTLTNARLVDPEGDRVFEGGLVIRDGRIAEVFEGARPGEDCGGRCLAPGHHRHRRQGRRARRAPQGELPHRRRRRRRGGRHDDRHPARHGSADRHPRDARVPPAPRGRRQPGQGAADGGADQGPRGPRDDRDRLPDGRRRRRLHRRPRAVASARVFQRCLTYATGLGALVVGHPQEPVLSEGACITTGPVRLAARPARRLAHRRAHGARARPRPRRGDRRALPRRPDLDGAQPAGAAPRPRGGAPGDRGHLDPPPDAERVRRRRLPHLLQADPAAALRGRPHGDGRGAGGGRDRRRSAPSTPRRTRRRSACPSRRPRAAPSASRPCCRRRCSSTTAATSPCRRCGGRWRSTRRGCSACRRPARRGRAGRPRALRPRHALRARPGDAALEVEEHPLRPPRGCRGGCSRTWVAGREVFARETA